MCTGSLAIGGGGFGAGIGRIVAVGLRCSGEEGNLLECPFDYTFLSVLYCSHQTDAGVLCPGMSIHPSTPPCPELSLYYSMSIVHC